MYLSHALALHLLLPLTHSFMLNSGVPLKPTFSSPLRSTAYTDSPTNAAQERTCCWTPQDLAVDNPGFPPIPDDDYIKKYQSQPEALWPVEFFLITYRRTKQRATSETQVLVRRSANGTSKYGLGTGVPVTRWLLSDQQQPPFGYRRKSSDGNSCTTFAASNYPEFRTQKDGNQHCDWTYDKIDIRADAFTGPDVPPALQDAALAEHAKKIRNALQKHFSSVEKENLSSWDSSVVAVMKNILADDNSVAAIHGTLRMSGLFEHRATPNRYDKEDDSCLPRYISLNDDASNPTKLASTVRVYTMFPQMPDPMPHPSTSAADLREEIATRPIRMAQSGRDPHQDTYGRRYTHISTSNVSNTIHGVYLTLDATGLPGLDDDDDVVPALDLMGKERVAREWVSLQDLKVLADDGHTIGTWDTKPTFISGFIVRQLIREGVIQTGEVGVDL